MLLKLKLTLAFHLFNQQFRFDERDRTDVDRDIEKVIGNVRHILAAGFAWADLCGCFAS